ncbi:MAG: hypothetical protein M3Y33_14550 [Actinomycetota bacterium]|nr:hypothetical protein [Actinomycetota bacterium]
MAGKAADGRQALEQGAEEFHVALAGLGTVLARSSPGDVGDVGAVRLGALTAGHRERPVAVTRRSSAR